MKRILIDVGTTNHGPKAVIKAIVVTLPDEKVDDIADIGYPVSNVEVDEALIDCPNLIAEEYPVNEADFTTSWNNAYNHLLEKYECDAVVHYISQW